MVSGTISIFRFPSARAFISHRPKITVFSGPVYVISIFLRERFCEEHASTSAFSPSLPSAKRWVANPTQKLWSRGRLKRVASLMNFRRFLRIPTRYFKNFASVLRSFTFLTLSGTRLNVGARVCLLLRQYHLGSLI